MLDMYLKLLSVKTAEEEATSRQVELLKKLPNELLYKIAKGEEKIGCVELAGGGESWLAQFKGTPLLEQALELEEQSLQLEAMSNQRRHAEDEQVDQERMMRDEISIRRRMLQLELARQQAGGSEPQEDEPSEEMAPPPMAQEAAPSAAPASKEAAKKIALAITPEGHAYDAAVNRIKEEAALKRLALSQQHGGVGAWDEKGRLHAGSVLKAMRGFASGLPGLADDPRALAYRAAKHEAGKNPWNPFGGSMTPHPAEGAGARWWRGGDLRDMDTSTSTTPKAVKRKAAEKEASVAPEKIAAMRFGAAAEKMKKEAVGAAMMQGLRQAGGFLSASAKGLKGAYQSGGMKQVGQALKTQGQLASAGAKNFIQQNPLAGAGLAAGTAGAAGLGAGYMAGRR